MLSVYSISSAQLITYHANVSVIVGYDEARGIKNLTFENLKINGTIISDDMPGKPGWYKTGDIANFFIGEHVTGVRFINTVSPATNKP